MKLKLDIYHHCLRLVNDKVVLLQQLLDDLKESSSNETKSTAGDKHETALAMLQIEQANVRVQLQDALGQKVAMEKINPALTPIRIVHGTLIKTNRGYLFMAVPLGRVLVDGHSVIVLSSQSPLGKKLAGLAAGDAVEINNCRYVVENIF